MSRRPKFQRRAKPGKLASQWPQGVGSPEELSLKVRYLGSPLHKTYPSPAGPPALRADKSPCFQFQAEAVPRLLDALQAAIRAGTVSEFQGAFPKHVWVWINGVLHEASLTNPATGEYHGYPLFNPEQYPAPREKLESAPRVEIPVV